MLNGKMVEFPGLQRGLQCLVEKKGGSEVVGVWWDFFFYYLAVSLEGGVQWKPQSREGGDP